MEAEAHGRQTPPRASTRTWTEIPPWAAKGIVWAIPFLLAIVASLLGVLVYMYVTDRAQNAAEHLELRQSVQEVRDDVQDVKVSVARIEEQLRFFMQQAQASDSDSD